MPTEKRDCSKFCATCGKPRGPLEQRRESWGLDMPTVLVPRREDPALRPWQQTNDLIINAAVWRNGGTSDDCHLCDDCLRVGLRAIKLRVDEALGAVEADADKDAELARLTQQVGRLQHELQTLRYQHELTLRRMAARPEEPADGKS